MIIHEQDSEDLYRDEYGVTMRRLTDMAAQTTPIKQGFGAALVHIGPGDVVTEHVNKPGVEEMFLWIEGSADYVLDGETYSLSEGDVAFAPVGVRHSFTSTGSGPGRFVTLWWRAAEAPPRA